MVSRNLTNASFWVGMIGAYLLLMEVDVGKLIYSYPPHHFHVCTVSEGPSPATIGMRVTFLFFHPVSAFTKSIVDG